MSTSFTPETTSFPDSDAKMFAGHTEASGNVALAAWLRQRLSDTGQCLHKDDFKVNFWGDDAMSLGAIPSPIRLFNLSHDSMQHVFDAMDENEFAKYIAQLYHLLSAQGSERPASDMLRSTPAQKFAAALLALGLRAGEG